MRLAVLAAVLREVDVVQQRLFRQAPHHDTPHQGRGMLRGQLDQPLRLRMVEATMGKPLAEASFGEPLAKSHRRDALQSSLERRTDGARVDDVRIADVRPDVDSRDHPSRSLLHQIVEGDVHAVRRGAIDDVGRGAQALVWLHADLAIAGDRLAAPALFAGGHGDHHLAELGELPHQRRQHGRVDSVIVDH